MIDTMRFTTKQGLAEAVVRGLAAQKWQVGYDKNEAMCRYSTHDGAVGCAIGVLMTPAQRAAYAEIQCSVFPESYVLPKNVLAPGDAVGIDFALAEFARRVQMVHDHVANISTEDDINRGDLLKAFLLFFKLEQLTWPEDVDDFFHPESS